MTPDPAAAARERLEALFRRMLSPVIASRDDMSAVIFADEVIRAFPSLAAPAQDAVEAARQVCEDLSFAYDESCVQIVAAALTAREARVREELARELLTVKWIGADRGWDEAIEAVVQHIRAGGGA